MQSKELKFKLVSLGAWGSYFDSYASLQALFTSPVVEGEPNKGPKPAVIPANERRRAPLSVRLAVESSLQATQQANISPEDLHCVFVSGLGDTDLTDYMCKTLAGETKALSPTKFHNSVHNAPAGYWTISTNTMSGANSVAGFENSVSLTLLESIVQCVSENVPVLITFYDAPVSPILRPLLVNTEPFAFSMIIYPITSEIQGTEISVVVKNKQELQWPELTNKNDYLLNLYQVNPCAKILCLAEKLTIRVDQTETVNMPLSEGSSLHLTVS